MSGANQRASTSVKTAVTTTSARTKPEHAEPEADDQREAREQRRRRSRRWSAWRTVRLLADAQHVEREEVEADDEGVDQHQPQRQLVAGQAEQARRR